MNLVRVKCAFCGKEFFRSKGRFDEAKKFSWKQYCSPKCLSKNRTKKQVLFCENCGKCFSRAPNNISPHNYCSQSCAAIVNNKKCPKRKARLKICVKCGGRFKGKTNKKYCSIKCAKEARKPNPQQLIDAIKEAAKKLKRIPAKRELKQIADSCRKVFGSWNNAVIAAGFQPNRSHENRMYKRIITKAADGHPCDSFSEAIIDNWLSKNNMPHKRDASYPNTHHKADWAVSIGNQKIFVEYFGLANDSPRYDQSIKEKKKLCHKNKISLIPIYPKDIYPLKNANEKLKEKFKNFLNG